MSSMKELKSDSNVILKLDLGEKGGIRRIRLNKIWNDDGVSYEKLKNVIMELDSTTTSSSSCKEVVVTYKDEDEDIITISTNEELSDAFLQFVDKVPPILRATATTTTTNNQTTSTNDSLPPPQVVKLIDAIHDAVSNALDTAWPPRRNSKTQSNNTTTPTTTTTTNSNNNSTHEQADTMAQKVVSNLKPENLTTHPSTSTTTNNNNTNTTNNNSNNNDNGSKKEEEGIKSKKESRVEEEVDWTKFDDSFIHGRHTCDGCLITPIVGIRYHAKNIVDYDLCQKCITKASNQNVDFQPAQLERDVPFQARWYRRQQRLELQRKQRLNFFNQSRCKQPPTHQEEEDIQEAIRLSLVSSNPDTTTTNQHSSENELQQKIQSLKPALDHHDTQNTTKDSPSIQNETKQPLDTHKNKQEEEEEMVETTILVTEQPTMISPLKQINHDKATKQVQTSTSKSCDESNYSDSSFAMDAEGSGDVAVAIGQTLDKCAEQINAIVSEISKSSSSSDAMSSSFTSFDSALQNHNDDTEKNAKTNNTDNHSTAGETILESLQDNDTKTKEEIDDDSWQVLENSQTIQDEMVARAASLLGSILFTSEITQDSSNDSKNEQDQQEQKQPFESFLSTESSVPSSVPSMESEIPVAVLSRWDVELKQLHEFGFLDDVKNVQVLEKLEAANIGSDCPEHVTVSQAIGELLDETKQEK